VAAVSLEVELALEGVVDGLDDLAEGLEEPGAGPFGLAFAGRAEQAQACSRSPSAPVPSARIARGRRIRVTLLVSCLSWLADQACYHGATVMLLRIARMHIRPISVISRERRAGDGNAATGIGIRQL